MTREEANYKLTAPGATGACGLRNKWDPDSQAHSPYVSSQFTLFATGLIEAHHDRGLGACLVDANIHSRTPSTAFACTYLIQ